MINNLAAGLVVYVKDRASGMLKTIGDGFGRLRSTGDKLKTGLTQIGTGLMGLAKMGAALGAAFGFMAYKAANFEQQMSAVRSVMVGATDAEFKALENEIKRLGATTKFSATEAAEGAELLARAGFSSAESVSALAGVLAAAAAEGVPMATAANIIANNVRAFGLEAEEATRVADILAITSAKTNTDIIQLGEGLKMVSSTSRQMGQSIEDTSFALGILANAGLQGSMGGTALNTMMLRMGNLSDASKKKFNELGIQIQDTHGDMLPLPQLMENMAKGLAKVGGNMDESAVIMDAFGIRGAKAANVLAAGFMDLTKKTADGKNGFDALRDSIIESEKAAERMAEERLNNLYGQLTLLSSALEAVSIEFMLPILKELAGSVRLVSEFVSNLAVGMQQVDDVLAGRYTPELSKNSKVTKEAALSIAELGAGLVLASRDIAAAIKWFNGVKEAMLGTFGGESSGMIGLGRFIGLSAAAAAAIGVLATIAGVVLVPVAGALFVSFEGVFAVLGVIAGLMPAITGLFIVFAGYVAATRKEGQSFGDRFIEIVSNVWSVVSGFYSGFYDGYMQMMRPAIDGIIENLSLVWPAVEPAFIALMEAFGMTAKEGEGMGKTIGLAMGFLANLLLLPVYVLSNFLAPAIGFFVKNLIVPLIESIGMIGKAFVGVISGTMAFKTAFAGVMKGVAGIIMNTLLQPFKMAIIGIMEAAAAIGAVSGGTRDAVKGFLNSEAGTFLGRDATAENAQSAAAKAAAEAHAAKVNALETGNRDRQQSVNGNLETKIEGCIKNDLRVSGKNLSIAESEHKFELAQRGGFKMDPSQQGPIVINGGLPSGAG